MESISNVFIGNTGVFNVSKSNSEPKERFAPAKTTQEIELHRRNSMAKKTREDMEYCLRIWNDSRKCRNEQSQIINMAKSKNWAKFVPICIRSKEKNGYQYPPKTLHHICCGNMRYLRSESHPDIDFFRNASFSRFREVLEGFGLKTPPSRTTVSTGRRTAMDKEIIRWTQWTLSRGHQCYLCAALILLYVLVRNIGLCD